MNAADNLFNTIKSLGKVVLQSRPCGPFRKPTDGDDCLVIMANGPSLAKTIAEERELLESHPTMAVNFAAIAPEFTSLRPAYYVLADPHFFREDTSDANLLRLRRALSAVDWPMTLFVPAGMKKTARSIYASPTVEIIGFNAVGFESWAPLEHLAFRMGLGMPRPRNVLIPALMLGIACGFKKIIVKGADHSWMQTIWVTDENEVVSVQPHFYKDDDNENDRVRHEYRGYRLHQIVESFAVAFRSYHHIANYARSKGVTIINGTPGSFIDAFPRG